MHQDKDRGSQWLFAHFGTGMLKLARVAHVASCKPVKDSLVSPRRAPDGLMEVTFTDRPGKALYLLEVESYASSDADRQMFENLMVVAADRREMPEAVVLVLRPKGNARVTAKYRLASQSGSTTIEASWHVVQLWDLKATDLLAENDVGVVPWLPLTQYDVPQEDLLRECLERIDRDAPPERREGLLAVTQIMAGFAMMEKRLMSIFSATSPLFDTPYMQEVKEQLKKRLEVEVKQRVEKEVAQRVEKEVAQRVEKEVAQRVEKEVAHNVLIAAINDNLSARFQFVPPAVQVSLNLIADQTRLSELHNWSAVCPDLAAFQSRLTSE